MKLFALTIAFITSFSAMALTGSCAGKLADTEALVCVQLDTSDAAWIASLKQKCDGVWNDAACPSGAQGTCTAQDPNLDLIINVTLYNATAEILANGKASCENDGGTWH
jgi:hypothetical protein